MFQHIICYYKCAYVLITFVLYSVNNQDKNDTYLTVSKQLQI